MKRTFSLLIVITTSLISAGCSRLSPSPTITPALLPTVTKTNTVAPADTATKMISPTPSQTPIPSPTNTFAWSPPVPNILTQTPYPPPNGFEEYVPRSFASVIAENSESIEQEVEYAILPDLPPMSAIVEYSGALRPIEPNHVVLLWALSTSLRNERFTTLYKNELLVREGALEFWMPIQEPLIPYLENELTKGQFMTVYVRLAGLIKTDQGMEFVFLINEFHR